MPVGVEYLQDLFSFQLVTLRELGFESSEIDLTSLELLAGVPLIFIVVDDERKGVAGTCLLT